MKKFFRRRRPAWLPSGGPVGGALVLGVLVFAGCGRRPPAAEAPAAIPAAETNPAPAAANQPAYVPSAAPATVAASPEGGADLKQLNQAYIGWIVQNRRRPKTFAEFVTLSGINVPPAPAGKKYVFDKSGFITLADQ